MRACVLLLSLPLLSSGWYYGRDAPDRWSVGGVFPLPEQIIYGKTNRSLDPVKIGFNLGDKYDCDILRVNSENYLNKWMFPFPVSPKGSAEDFVISVKTKDGCPTGTPPHNVSEEYKLRISMTDGSIRAENVWGVVRAMETLSQLIFWDEKKQKYFIRTADVQDKPRFPIRGLMIDSSRHFLSVKTIKRQIDLMAMNKMNVLHWHLVDSEAFPYESKKFPNLHTLGAYSHRHVYSRNDVQDIINYARLRAIRVIPEFDLPGHTGAWNGQEGFLTECYDAEGKETWKNLIDPSHDPNYKFIEDFLKEVTETFPDEFLHLGGDEVEDFIVECWDRNEKIQAFKKEKNLTTNTDLENYFFEKLDAIVAKFKNQRKKVVWEEVFYNNKPNNNTIVHIWRGNSHEEIHAKTKLITNAGYPVILSSCWYLNYIKYGADWRDNITNDLQANSMYYYCDPANFTGSTAQKNLVLGGIVAMWGEMVDNTNIESRTWPRASAVAERLWSPAEKTKDANDAWPRMHELRCRQVARGYRIQPVNNPDYCPFEYDDR